VKRLGEAVRTASGLVIVQTEGTPRIGAEAVDESLDTVGRVVDVFGPVESPYAAVTPAGTTTVSQVVGQTLYTE
jgi:snoRNP protein GAR1